jgi:N-acetylglucosaminyldiphosphoundecaprenol N-acetyl-beta-D-mannosaminyltransferase
MVAVSIVGPPAATVLGVRIDRADYASALALVLGAARAPRPLRVTCAAVHLVMEARRDPELARALQRFDAVLPDGQPVRWALGAAAPMLADRVYGPELMRRACIAAADERLPVFLYGAGPETAARLPSGLAALAPGIEIAGAESPPFGDGLWAEGPAAAARIRGSGARLVFVGLGCPRQERWVDRFADEVGAPCVAVGAAFDLWAGRKAMAPTALQRAGLEWLYRFATEPRTWRRYVEHNPRFAVLAGLEAAGRLLSARRARRGPQGSSEGGS